MKVHYSTQLSDGTVIPPECDGPYDFDRTITDGKNDSSTITCRSCGAQHVVREL